MSRFSVFESDRQDTGTLAGRSGLIERSRSPDPDYLVFADGKDPIDLAGKEALRPKIANHPLFWRFTLSGAMYGTTERIVTVRSTIFSRVNGRLCLTVHSKAGKRALEKIPIGYYFQNQRK